MDFDSMLKISFPKAAQPSQVATDFKIESMLSK